MDLSVSININSAVNDFVEQPVTDDFIINLITEFETNEFILDLIEETE